MSEFNKYRLKVAYHWLWYETEDWYKWLVDRCVNFCSGHTIDIGCGDGLLVSKLLTTCQSVTGIDPDEYAISFARQNCFDGVFIQRGIENEDGIYDYLTCLNAVEHMEKPELLKDFIRNNITKGAIIITIDYQGGSLGEDHKFEWTMDEMMEFFKEFNPKPFRYKDTEWIGVEIRK